MKRRASRRFEVRAPIVFSWEAEGDETVQGAGFSRDIATGGVFVWCATRLPRVGSDVTIQLLLPALEETGHGLRINADGRVTRVESVTTQSGIAVEFIPETVVMELCYSDNLTAINQ